MHPALAKTDSVIPAPLKRTINPSTKVANYQRYRNTSSMLSGRQQHLRLFLSREGINDYFCTRRVSGKALCQARPYREPTEIRAAPRARPLPPYRAAVIAHRAAPARGHRAEPRTERHGRGEPRRGRGQRRSSPTARAIKPPAAAPGAKPAAPGSSRRPCPPFPPPHLLGHSPARRGWSGSPPGWPRSPPSWPLQS